MSETVLRDIPERLDRYRQFYANSDPALLVQIQCRDHDGRADSRRPTFLKRLAEYDFSEQAHRRRWYEEVVQEVIDENSMHPLPDDYLPSAKVLLGQLQSLIIKDRPVHHSGHSTWVDPCIDEYEDLQELSCVLDESNPWWALFADAKRYACEHLGDAGFVATIHGTGPMDLAFDLRGTALYTDLFDNQEGVHALMEFCTDSLIRMSQQLRRIRPTQPTMPPRSDGTFWVPGWGYNVMVPGFGGHTTVDASCQLSREMFEEFEAPYLERLFRDEPGWLMHTHSVGTHQQRAYANLPGVEILQVVTDPNTPEPIDDIDGLLSRVTRPSGGTAPVLLTAPPERIVRNLDALLQGRIVARTSVATEAEGRDLLELVRRRSRIR
jgi:hypothetical protein